MTIGPFHRHALEMLLGIAAADIEVKRAEAANSTYWAEAMQFRVVEKCQYCDTDLVLDSHRCCIHCGAPQRT